ncbi:MAG: hypothetical protein AUK28_04305 [Desulfobacterales bacterium CG2_30_60_27]|nr:MAG: hypothetical protein AUK28_04305 [Desulfobacterales bacterium CG2_30_60_27]
MQGKQGQVRRGVVLALIGLLACGCTGFKSGQVKPDTAVKAGPPVVYIHPRGDIGWDKKVGVLPFLVPDNIGQAQGLRVAALFKDVLLGQRVFRTVEQLATPYGTLREALDLGRANGLDYVLAGQLGTVFEGSEFGGAQVEVSVRLLAVATGDTVWYLEQAVNQKIDYPEVGFLARLAAISSPPPIRTSGAPSPVPNMLARVATDMAGVMAGGEIR